MTCAGLSSPAPTQMFDHTGERHRALIRETPRRAATFPAPGWAKLIWSPAARRRTRRPAMIYRA